MRNKKILINLLKIISIAISVFLIIFFIGESNSDEFINTTNTEKLLLLFIPFIYIFATIILYAKEKLGSYLIILSVISFNLISWISEKSIQEFDFFALLLPAILILIIKYQYKEKEKESKKKIT